VGFVSQREFKPAEIIRVLAEHGVRCVYIGGYAAFLQGSPLPTRDIDITPESSTSNLKRLSAALVELRAGIRVDGDEPLPFAHDAESLRGMNVLNVTTIYGDLDIAMVPLGTSGYDDLIREALRVEIHGSPAMLASLGDIIRSKQAANRPKDQRALPVLREIWATRHEREPD
jgi:hypothetical protein